MKIYKKEEFEEVYKKIKKPFDEVFYRKIKVVNSAGNGNIQLLQIAPYITRTQVEDRLDEVLSPENYNYTTKSIHYERIENVDRKGVIKEKHCVAETGSIKYTIDGKNWIEKGDNGACISEDYTVAFKGASSDAFKRVARQVAGGVGRYLYKTAMPYVIEVSSKEYGKALYFAHNLQLITDVKKSCEQYSKVEKQFGKDAMRAYSITNYNKIVSNLQKHKDPVEAVNVTREAFTPQRTEKKEIEPQRTEKKDIEPQRTEKKEIEPQRTEKKERDYLDWKFISSYPEHNGKKISEVPLPLLVTNANASLLPTPNNFWKKAKPEYRQAIIKTVILNIILDLESGKYETRTDKTKNNIGIFIDRCFKSKTITEKTKTAFTEKLDEILKSGKVTESVKELIKTKIDVSQNEEDNKEYVPVKKEMEPEMEV